MIPSTTEYQTAMDVGCHWGRYTHYLSRTYQRVWGLDYSELAIETAIEAPNATYCCIDIERDGALLATRFPQMDLVTAIGLFEMVRDPAALSANLFASVRRGGKILALIPNRRSFNYLSLRVTLWLASKLRNRDSYIWNNGLTRERLRVHLQAAGFQVEREGSLVGVPVYVADRMPAHAQRTIIGMDRFLKLLLRPGYYWISATKP